MAINTCNRRMGLWLLLAFMTFTIAPASAQTLAERYRALWSEARDTYAQAVGYKGEVVPLDVSQLSSNASDREEGKHLEYLLDGDPTTFWHSDWHGEVQDTHYLQMDLPTPIEGSVAVYVRRRDIDSNHITLMQCQGSLDGVQWTVLGNMSLGSAAAGAPVTSTAVSLGGKAYRYLRLCFLENTGGLSFAHFAELRLLHVEPSGDDMSMYLGILMRNLLNELATGVGKPDAGLTEQMLANLREAREALDAEVLRVREGLLPSYMTQRSNLPTLYLFTYDGNAITSKTTYRYARLCRLEGDSTATYDSVRIRGRGNSTWTLAKKPYRIKFAHKEKFLGKGHANAKSWTLLANHSDKTLLRNAVASFIGKQLGQPFVPSAEFVDVVLNGEYLGNYQVSDQMEVHKKRVEIVEQETVPQEGDDITGGYFWEFAGTLDGEPAYFHTTRGQAVAIKSPDEDVLTEAQRTYLHNFVCDFEDRLYSTDYLHPLKGYRAVVDSVTLASWFVANEYTANPDGYYSTYAYKERGDSLLRWGPMWDYDIAFNNCHRLDMDMTEHLMLDEGYSSGKMKEYVQRMYADPWFRQLAGRRWHRAVCEEGLVERTLAYVDSMAQRIDLSQRLNFERWPINSRVYDEQVLFSTYQEGVDYLKRFLRAHADFLSATLPNPDGLTPPAPAPTNPLGVDCDSLYYIYNVNTGNAADVSATTNGTLCTWACDPLRAATQQWRIVPATAQYYRIELPGSHLAITDAAKQSGTSYVTGAALTLCDANDSEERQLWEFVPAGNHYAIVNKVTGLAWNNSGGKQEDGNPIISWTSNAANATKPTRQWYLSAAASATPDGIASTQEYPSVPFSVGYDRTQHTVLLHVAAEANPAQCTLTVHDTQGHLVGRGNATTPVNLSQWPAGIYVVSCTVQGCHRTIKFSKP